MNHPKLTRILYGTAVLLLLFAQALPAYSQVTGCKDPAASNYNPSATVNDGSCTYATTTYTPPVKVSPLSSILNETSAVRLAGNYLWSLNDAGNSANIYRIDSVSNTILQTVSLGGASNQDWEDIAFDGTNLYIGDFGNNFNGGRSNFTIYKIPLSVIPDHLTSPVVTIPAGQIESIRFTYSDQVPPAVPPGANNTKFDCAAMIIDEGKIHLFTKNWIDINTTHYVINGLSAGNYVASPIETLATDYLVTSADKLPGSNVVVLLGYQFSGFANHYMHFLTDFSGGFYFNGNKRKIDLPNALTMGQAEGITFRNADYGYITNERIVYSGFTITPKLRSFNTSSFVPAYVLLPMQLTSFGVTKAAGTNQVAWNFASSVQQMRVQYSTNRTDFATVQTYATAKTGSFSHLPVAPSSCYRLAWKSTSGADQYSDVVCVNNEVNSGISNLVLRSNGELMLTKTGTAASGYSLNLITTDGRLVAQTTGRSLVPGVNKINFQKNLSRNSIIVVEIVNGKERNTVLLKVE